MRVEDLERALMDVQALVSQLQDALGVKVICGAITLNLNDSRVQSVETRTHQRIVATGKIYDSPLDTRLSLKHD